MSRIKFPIAVAIFNLAAGAVQASGPEIYLDEPEVHNFRLALAEIREVPTAWYVGLGYSVTSNSLGGLLSSRDGSLPVSFAFGSQQPAQNFGLLIGARRQLHGYTFGAELGYDFLNAASVVTNTYTFGGGPIFGPPGDVTLTQRASLSNNVHFRGIVGTELAGLVLYGALGLAGTNASVSVESDAIVDGQPIGRFASRSNSMVGLHAAFGVEAPISQDFSVRLEYAYNDYGSFRYEVEQTDVGASTTHSFSARSHQIRLNGLLRF